MSKVFMCDRCKVYRTDGPHNYHHDTTLESLNPEGDTIGTYELCANCSKAFKEFIANRPMEGK